MIESQNHKKHSLPSQSVATTRRKQVLFDSSPKVDVFNKCIYSNGFIVAFIRKSQLKIDAVILVECYVYFRLIDLVESNFIVSLQSYTCYRVIF